MPLLIKEKDVAFHETEELVYIKVKWPPKYTFKPSITCTTKYVKISSPPYIWECFLNETVDTEKATVKIADDEIFFELPKTDKIIWKQLKHSNSGNSTYCKAERQSSEDEIRESLAKKKAQMAKEAQEKQREAVRKDMRLDDEERLRVENMKMAEKKRTDDEIEKWKKEVTQYKKRSSAVTSNKLPLKKETLPLPPPRSKGNISIKFTSRVFPTPSRESQEPGETEWLETQKVAQRSLNFDCADLKPEQRNPAWLEMKGDKLKGLGDFQGAVNAYSLAIRMNPNSFNLYTSRAHCHLNLNNLHKTLKDSSQALDLLNVTTTKNINKLVENYLTRGTAFERLDLCIEGLMDMEAALKLVPHNEEIAEKAEDIRERLSKKDMK